MAKIMLVEDDNNLREIYEARLLAEGYQIVSAHDGEEALALAVKEKPDLIISDVMMPKISGFDMLDILRSTPETKDTKVIMMTALSQAEDKQRADKLGADRYLVKSQVTLEDVAKIAREVLEGTGAPTASAPTSDDSSTSAVAPPADTSGLPPVPPSSTVSPTSIPVMSPPDPIVPAPAPEPTAIVPEPTAIVPAPDPSSTPITTADATDSAQTVSNEKASLDSQVEDAMNKAPVAPAPAENSSVTTDSGKDPNLISL